MGLALAPSSQSPKVHFCDGCSKWERCREGWGTSARADNGGQSMSGLYAVDWLSHITHSLTDLMRTCIFLSLFASQFHSVAFCCSYQRDAFLVYHTGAPLSLALLPA